MAKSRSFFGLRRGSTKSFTFSILGGQQITKDRVVEVKNPRTYAQQFQRAKFASMVKFFKQLPTGLLTYAYEDKKTTESYYNAFMRHNNNRVCTYLAEQNRNKNLIAVGDVQLTVGSLPDIKVMRGVYDESVDPIHDFATNFISDDSGTLGTVASVSKMLILNNFAVGDIVNIVLMYDDSDVTQLPPYFENAQNSHKAIYSFIVDPTDETEIYKKRIGDTNASVTVASVEGNVHLQVNWMRSNIAIAFVVSRKTTSGVKVSTSNMATTQAVPLDVLLIDSYSSPSRPGVASNAWSKLVAQSYEGEEGDAILQGGLIDEDAELKIVARPDVPATWTTLSGKSITFNKPLDTPRSFYQVYGVMLDFKLSTGRANFINGPTWDAAYIIDESIGKVCDVTISADKKTVTFGTIEAGGTNQVVSIDLRPVED